MNFFRLSLYSTTKIYVQGSVLYAKLTARSGVAATVRSGLYTTAPLRRYIQVTYAEGQAGQCSEAVYTEYFLYAFYTLLIVTLISKKCLFVKLNLGGFVGYRPPLIAYRRTQISISIVTNCQFVKIQSISAARGLIELWIVTRF